MILNFDRSIDDPGLNQDAAFEKKDDENFNERQDFHKLDDTSKNDIVEDESKSKSARKNSKKIVDTDTVLINKNGKFDGSINI